MPLRGVDALHRRTGRLSSSGGTREREIIAANLMASRLTLFYGPSGVGKSSVLNAGVAHRPAREAATAIGLPARHRRFRDGRVPQLARRAASRGLDRTIEQEIGAPGDRRDVPRPPAVAATERIDGDLLIILDQFEEYFLYHAGRTATGRSPSNSRAR